jgi:hypothetical protein
MKNAIALVERSHEWGGHEQDDLRDAIACELLDLEHLLEYHFVSVFPRVRELAQQDRLFADMFCRCWKFGQSEPSVFKSI